MPDQHYYIKSGRRYIPAVPWRGFPANGLWYVEDGRSSLLMKVGELPDPMPLAAMERHSGAAVAAMSRLRDAALKGTTGYSLQDMWRAAIKGIAEAMEKEKTDGNP